jgi:hypothetical protein
LSTPVDAPPLRLWNASTAAIALADFSPSVAPA